MKPVNKSDSPASKAEVLLDQMAGMSPGQSIAAQEARGQASFVASDVLPAQGPSYRPPLEEDPEVQALGIEWGELVEGDPLFRYAKLPAGWSKRAASDHSMWSDVVDETGKVRARVFYKAAFYDRKAWFCVARDEPGGVRG